jgi:hypothetical protein
MPVLATEANFNTETMTAKSPLSFPWTSFEDCGYVAEYARTGRSTCKEFRCKSTIAKGQLRIGIDAGEETDQSGRIMGWYHPTCVFRTFGYSSNANKKILSPEDIQGHGNLELDDKALIRGLIADGPPPIIAPMAALMGAPSTNAPPVKIYIHADGGLRVTGNTFDIKDGLKKAGGRWDGDAKAWGFAPGKPFDTVSTLLGFVNAAAQSTAVQGSTMGKPTFVPFAKIDLNATPAAPETKKRRTE